MAKTPEIVQLGPQFFVRLKPPKHRPRLGPFYSRVEALRAQAEHAANKPIPPRKLPSDIAIELHRVDAGWQVIARLQMKTVPIGVWPVRTKAKLAATVVKRMFSRRSGQFSQVCPPEIWPTIHDSLKAAGIVMPKGVVMLV